MVSNELFLICCVAFLMVFAILAFLALVMRLIILAFPEKAAETNGAMIAALTSTLQTIFPQTKITKIEEEK